ncbi:carboxy terminal-processing peptidase [Mesonia maritima]|uniref:carboxy terminal-processing peptidase n=1 Tax=Mesonia maritima TaxID=1793873 RepID=UPI0035E605DA
MERSHYQPKPLTDSLSSSVFKLFIKNLDPDAEFFTQENYSIFKEDRFQLDDNIKNHDCDFIEKYNVELLKQIFFVKNFLNDFNTEKFQYNNAEKITLNPEAVPFSIENNIALKEYWRKKIKKEILDEIVEQDTILSSIQKNFNRLEKEIKPKIIAKNLCLLNEISLKDGNVKEFAKNSFLNALLKYQDPHSSFFSNSEKVGFERSISSNQESFGFSTEKNDSGEIVVRYISPGSPAFKHADFEVNDIIKSLESNGDVLKTYCVSDEDIQDFTRAEDHKTILFTLKKKNGRIQQVKLTRTLQKVEENSITGFIVEKDKKFGYIKLPSFYTDLESPNGLGVANDVAKQLYKLQQENIEGLILDLRFNGGGAMKEATDLSGMFINKGPLSILKYNNGETFTIKDANRGSLFTKPMVVLVNHFSASASEFFSAAMQDYNRALIVGTPTHGKASAQVILPLDETDQDLGFVKLTVEKFYRSTGRSHQGIGVQPDILLPSLYDGLKTSEKFQDFALKADSAKITLKPRPLPTIPIQHLKRLSEERVANNKGFHLLKQTNKNLVKAYFDTSEEILTPIENYNRTQEYKDLWKPYTNFKNEFKTNFTTKNTNSTTEVLSYSPDYKTMNEQVIEEISSEIYIEEAYNILTDYINLQNH